MIEYNFIKNEKCYLDYFCALKHNIVSNIFIKLCVFIRYTLECYRNLFKEINLY